jgi:hypothetical protein
MHKKSMKRQLFVFAPLFLFFIGMSVHFNLSAGPYHRHGIEIALKMIRAEG